MSKKHKKQKKQRNPSHLLLKDMSDKECIELANKLQGQIGSPSFTASDFILREAVISHLEDRGFVVTEVLEIVHIKELESLQNTPRWGDKKDKEEDGKEESGILSPETLEAAAKLAVQPFTI